MPAIPMTVVETPFFLRQAADPFADTELALLAKAIGMDPECGEIIPGTGGV